MAYIGKVPTAVPLTSSDLADGIVTSAKISDGSITATDMDLSGTYAFTGTVTGAGESNVPAWSAYLSSDQTLVGDTNAKVLFDSEILDSNSAFDTSNNRFTVPTGQSGKYFYVVNFINTFGSGFPLNLQIYKNGVVSQKLISVASLRSTSFQGIIDLSAGDYIELYYSIEENPVSGVIGGGQYKTRFIGYKVYS